MAAKKKTSICKLCGREFVPANPGDKYCPGVCSLTAGLIKTPKPRKASPASSGTPKAGGRSMEEKFPRVMAMLAAPISKRWAMASKFTPEEEEFSRKMQRKMLAEERRIDFEANYCGRRGAMTEDDEAEQPQEKVIFEEDPLGDSDDGSV